MPFNTAECEVVAFNDRESLSPSYKIGDQFSSHMNEIKYLSVIMQSNIKFNNQVASKNALGWIKYMRSAKLLAYTSLCRSVFKYTDALWDPAVQYNKLKLCKQSNKICQKLQRTTWHHGGLNNSWTGRTKR